MLTPSELELAITKHRANRLSFAILLTFFREHGRFPRDETEVEMQGIAALSQQLDVPAPAEGEAFLTGRTAERVRAETEAILWRFTKKNVQHPTYRAFADLGKAIKTIFLCRYLHDEALRREINEGLNVVEQ